MRLPLSKDAIVLASASSKRPAGSVGAPTNDCGANGKNLHDNDEPESDAARSWKRQKMAIFQHDYNDGDDDESMNDDCNSTTSCGSDNDGGAGVMETEDKRGDGMEACVPEDPKEAHSQPQESPLTPKKKQPPIEYCYYCSCYYCGCKADALGHHNGAA